MALVLDHIGLVTHSIDLTARFISAISDFREPEPVVYDPEQDVKVQFLNNPSVPFPRIELIEPGSPSSPIQRVCIEGGGVHHLCFQVAALDTLASWARERRLTIVRAPRPAIAFGGKRQVAFVQVMGVGLVEFVETEGAPALETIEDLPVGDLTRTFMAARKAAQSI